MNGTHGKVGGNLFLAAYVVAILMPLVEVGWSPQRSIGWTLGALCAVVTTGVVTTRFIRRHGHGGGGEAWGLALAVVAWLGRWGAPALASRIGIPLIRPGLWPLLGASMPVLVIAGVVWLERGRASR